jgi:hypothetical protein
MSLIVEDGTGLATAESYISVADASTYHSNRGNAAWAALASDAVREQNLRKATDYMVQCYRSAWKGVRVGVVQALDWPRFNVYSDESLVGAMFVFDRFLIASNVVPVEVQRACAELALKASAGELNPDLEQGVVSETVGPISTTYNVSTPQYKRFRAIDMMLHVLLESNGVCVSVGRA